MRVLTRHIDEPLKVRDDIVITVVSIQGNAVRIGIEAPRNVRIIREELQGQPRGRSSPSERPPVTPHAGPRIPEREA